MTEKYRPVRLDVEFSLEETKKNYHETTKD